MHPKTIYVQPGFYATQSVKERHKKGKIVIIGEKEGLSADFPSIWKAKRYFISHREEE